MDMKDLSYASVSKDGGLSLAMDRRRFLQCAVGAGTIAGLRGSAFGLMQNNAGAQSGVTAFTRGRAAGITSRRDPEDLD